MLENIKIVIMVLMLQMIASHVKAFDYVIDGLYYNIIDTEKKFVEVTFGLDTLNSYKLEKITVPDKVMIDGEAHLVIRIGARAFMGCERLFSIELLPGIISIGNSSFAACKNLQSVVLPETIERIDIFAFAMCEKLPTIKLPSRLDRIPDALFAGCTGLQTITIPEGVSYIGQKAFILCSNLQSISIPENVVHLNGCATFLGCTNLKEFVIKWKKPKRNHGFLFNDIDVKKCILIVPKHCVFTYRKAKGWKKFKHINATEDFAKAH